MDRVDPRTFIDLGSFKVASGLAQMETQLPHGLGMTPLLSKDGQVVWAPTLPLLLTTTALDDGLGRFAAVDAALGRAFRYELPWDTGKSIAGLPAASGQPVATMSRKPVLELAVDFLWRGQANVPPGSFQELLMLAIHLGFIPLLKAMIEYQGLRPLAKEWRWAMAETILTISNAKRWGEYRYADAFTQLIELPSWYVKRAAGRRSRRTTPPREEEKSSALDSTSNPVPAVSVSAVSVSASGRPARKRETPERYRNNGDDLGRATKGNPGAAAASPAIAAAPATPAPPAATAPPANASPVVVSSPAPPAPKSGRKRRRRSSTDDEDEEDIPYELIIGIPAVDENGRPLFNRHGKQMIRCGICGVLLQDPNSMYRHKNQHNKKRRVPCPVCLGTFTQNNNLHQHMGLVHAPADLTPEQMERTVARGLVDKLRGMPGALLGKKKKAEEEKQKQQGQQQQPPSGMAGSGGAKIPEQRVSPRPTDKEP